jgi:hypothetical protein
MAMRLYALYRRSRTGSYTIDATILLTLTVHKVLALLIVLYCGEYPVVSHWKKLSETILQRK